MKIIVLGFLFFCAATSVVVAQKKVVCFWGTWATYRQGYGKFNVEDIDPTICTHIIYSFLGARSDGSVYHLDSYLDLTENWGRGYIEKFVALRSKSPSTKFLMSIGGWNAGSKVFSEIASSESRRNAFAQNVLNVVNKFNFDGFDFDWEYPAQRDSNNQGGDKANFVELLRALKAKLGSKVLSIAVGAAESSASVSYDIPNVVKYVDLVNLMSYDLHGSWDSKTGINAPLYAGPSDVSSYERMLNVDTIVKYWLSKGCPKEKLIVGIPLYGRTFTLANANNNGVGAPAYGAGAVGQFVAEAGFLGYNEICFNINTKGWRRYWEGTQKVPYAVKDNQWVGYDDAESLSYKLDYIKSRDLGGAMFWSIETEDFANICGKGKFPLLKMTYSALVGNAPIVIPTQGPFTTPKTTTTTKGSSGGGGGGGSVTPCSNGDGLYKDSNNCNAFFNCANGVAFHQFCAPGLYFNPIGKYCDWPYNVSC